MSIIDGLTSQFTKAAKSVAKGTNKVMETSKLSLTLIEKEDELTSLYAGLGKKISKIDDNELLQKLDISDILADINSLKGEIVELKIKISELKNTKKCPDCGATINKNSAFCSSCGSKLN